MVGSGITWNYEELDGYLKKPSKYVKGTAMSFAGLKKPAQRAAVIEYLRVNGSEGLAKPAPAAAAVIEASASANEIVVQDAEMVEKAPKVETTPLVEKAMEMATETKEEMSGDN